MDLDCHPFLPPEAAGVAHYSILNANVLVPQLNVEEEIMMMLMGPLVPLAVGAADSSLRLRWVAPLVELFCSVLGSPSSTLVLSSWVAA